MYVFFYSLIEIHDRVTELSQSVTEDFLANIERDQKWASLIKLLSQFGKVTFQGIIII